MESQKSLKKEKSLFNQQLNVENKK